MRYNLHTHSFYCGHGSGRIDEYYDYADSLGFSFLGFSEHCPFPDETYKTTRMPFSQMEQYEEDVNALKGKGTMDVLLGYECDYLPAWHGYFEDLRGRVDYLISGTHFIQRPDGKKTSPFREIFSKKDIPYYTKMYIEAMETGLFSFMAHPDVFLLNYKWDESAESASRDIIEASIELDIPLEINSNGIVKAIERGDLEYGYPNMNFWALAKDLGAKAVVSSDAHSVANLFSNYDRVYDFAHSTGIELLEPMLSDGKLAFRKVQGM